MIHGRTKVKLDVFYDLMGIVCEEFGIKLNKKCKRKFINILLASLATFLYNNPNKYFTLACFDIYRSNLIKDNLYVVSHNKKLLRDVVDPNELYTSILNEEIEKEELKELFSNYYKDLYEYSKKSEQEISEQIEGYKDDMKK